MPESPEVQELATFLAARTRGVRVSGFDIALPKLVKTSELGPSDLVGRRITDVRRAGKMIDIRTADDDGGVLSAVVHFGHDGWVLWHDLAPDGIARAGEATLMARIRLENGSGFDLTDAGQWKMLTVHIVPDAQDVPAVAKLGLDPLAEPPDLERFAGILSGRRKQIKALLQDQSEFAGIGNAYSDEILHAAKLSPIAHASSLSAEQVATLASATWRVLGDAASARHGLPPDQLRPAKHAALRVHRKTGEACPVCGDRIRQFSFSGAAAQYCPTCQTGGALLA